MHADDGPSGRPDDTRSRMRDALRRNAARARDGAAAGVRRGAPHAFVAVLVAAALAPVAGAAAGGAAVAGVLGAVLEQVGQVGAGYLVEAVLEARRRLAGAGAGTGPPDEGDLVDAIAAELERRLAAGDAAAGALRTEMSGLLQAVDAVQVLLDDRLGDVRDDLARGLLDAARRDEEFGWLVGGVDERVRAVQEQLSRMEAADRQRAATTERSLVTLALLRQDVQRLLRRADAVALPDPTPGGGSAPAPGDCPYPGLAPFRTQDAAWFRGRDELVATLVARLAAGLSPVVVLGASGAGKSSLLAAGLLPALLAGALPEPGSQDRPHVVLTPGPHPLDALAAAVAVLTGAEAGAVAAGLRDEPGRLRAALLQAAVASRPGGAPAVTGPGPGREAVVVVDQLEELFTMCDDDAQRQGFLDALAAATGVAHVVLGVRADFYAACVRHPFLREALATATVHVGPMTSEELRVAVTDPAVGTGWTVEPGLVDVLLADLGSRPGRPYPAGALPLLAHALQGTWLRREGRTLTVAGYRATGGLDGAVAATAESVHDALDEPGRATLRHLATALVDDTATGERTRRRLPVADALRAAGGGAVARDVLARLVAARLVTTSTTDDAGTVELTHEAVVAAWPRLRDWLDDDAGARRERRALEAAAAEWERVGRDDGALLRGARLTAALVVLDDPVRRARLTDAEAALVEASVGARESALRTARRRARRLGALAGGLAVLTVASGGATVVAVSSRATAQTQRVQAVSRQLAAEALAARTSEPRRAKLLAVAAWRTARTVESRSALLSLQAQPYAGELSTGVRQVGALAVSPDGRRLAVAGADGTVELLDAATGVLVRRLDGVVEGARGIRWTAGGRWLVAAGISGDGAGNWVRWWDGTSGEPAGTMSPGPVASLAVGPDPDLVAVGTGAGTTSFVRVLSLSRRAVVSTTPAADGFVWGLAFSPDGRRLAGGTQNGAVLVWRTRDGRPTVLGDQPVGVLSVAWAPDARSVFAGGQDGLLRRWPLTPGATTPPALGFDGASPVALNALAMSPDGRVLVGSGRGVQRWQASDGLTLGAWRMPPVVVTALGWSPDGRFLFAGTVDGTVTRWSAGVRTDPWFDRDVLAVALSSVAGLVAEGGIEGSVRIRSTADGRVVRTLRSDPVLGLAFTPDGRTLVGGDVTGVVRSWDVATGREVRRASVAGPAPGRSPETLTVSPDGRTVAVTTGGATVTTRSDAAAQAASAAVVVRWDLETGRVFPDLAAPGRPVRGAGFTADGRHLVVGLGAGTAAGAALRTYDVSSGAVVAETPVPAGVRAARVSAGGRTAVVTADDGTVRLLRLSPDGARTTSARTVTAAPTLQLHDATLSADGRTLAVVLEDDPRVRLFDARTGQPTADLTFHGDAVRDAALSGDGRTLVTGASDSWSVTWSLDPAVVERDLCSDVSGPDVLSEWRQIVGRSKGAVQFPC